MAMRPPMLPSMTISGIKISFRKTGKTESGIGVRGEKGKAYHCNQ